MPKRNSVKLTETYITKSLKLPPTGRIEVFDSQEDSLCLRVSSAGRRSWCVYYRLGRQNRKFTIGAYPSYSIVEARLAAAETKKLALEGKDPVDLRRRQRASYLKPNSVEEMSKLFLERYVDRHLKASTARDYKSHFRRHIIPAWKGRGVKSITREDVIKLLDKIEDQAPIQCNRTQATISKWFSWMTDERAILAVNPLLRLKKRTPENRRSRVLNDTELSSIWHTASEMENYFGIICKLLMLTAKRRAEVAGMKWSEINAIDRIWTIPGGREGRTKNKLDDVVPLSDQVLTILQSLPRDPKTDYIFPSRNNKGRPVSGFSRAQKNFIRYSGVENWTFHDLRRTVRSNLSRLHIPKEVADKVLNHVDNSVDGRHYDWHSYLSEKRDALQTWGNALDQILQQPSVRNVIQIGRSQ